MAPGRFHEAGAEYGVDRNEDGRAQAGMGVDFADVDNDGRFDYFVTNFSHDTNTLYRNAVGPGGGTFFEDLTYSAKLGLGSFRMLGWGTVMADLDPRRLARPGDRFRPRLPGGTGGHRGQLLRPAEPGLPLERQERRRAVTFSLYEPPPGDGLEVEAVSRGLVLADLDDDGDSDLFFVNMHATPTLLRNDLPKRGRWIGFALTGAGPNRAAIGARLEIEDSSGVLRFRERTSGASYLSTNDPRLIVGLGEAGGPVRVTVRWPGGERTVHDGLEPARYWTLDVSGSAAPR